MIDPAGTPMRVSRIGLFLLGAMFLFASICNATANVALGNSISGGFLYALLAFGIVGATAMFIGALLYFRTLPSPKA
jgi:formate-dependent nitrite reductase membrane component NrfD